MSGLDKELEAAYAATKKNQEKLEASKDELREVSDMGQQLASRSRTIGLIAALSGGVIGSAILLYDPESRPWGFMLIFVVAVGAAWSFYRNWKK